MSIALLIVLAFLAVGCNRYDSKFYDDTTKWMDEEFLIENSTKGAILFQKYYDEEAEKWRYEHVENPSTQDTRVFIIQEQAEFDEIFVEFPDEVDFDNKTVIVYLFTTVDTARAFFLINIRRNAESLNVKFKMQNSRALDASMPSQRCFVLMVNKTDISTVNFVEID